MHVTSSMGLRMPQRTRSTSRHRRAASTTWPTRWSRRKSQTARSGVATRSTPTSRSRTLSTRTCFPSSSVSSRARFQASCARVSLNTQIYTRTPETHTSEQNPLRRLYKTMYTHRHTSPAQTCSVSPSCTYVARCTLVSHRHVHG